MTVVYASFNALSYTILAYSKTLSWFLKAPCLIIVGVIIPFNPNNAQSDTSKK